MPMRSLVVGASGFLGGAILDRLRKSSCEAWGTCCSFPLGDLLPLDLRKKSEIAAIFDWIRPQLVFQTAFNANVDLCEEEPTTTRKANVRGTEVIVEALKGRDVRYVFYSSDYIFDGTAGPYTEEDVPRPINEYGRQKLECEEIIQTELDDYAIVRTTVVYGREARKKNFVPRLLSSLSKGQRVRVPNDQVGTPTYVCNLADASLELAKRHDVGVFNIVGTTLTDRYSFARRAAETFGLPAELILPVATSELRQSAPRPLKAGLSTGKVEQILKTRLCTASEGLARMRKESEKAGERWGRSSVRFSEEVV
jgi:dTDP-4-dehydrorhamnose reductase